MIVCRLRDILENRGISRRELARRSGLSINTVCKLASCKNSLLDVVVLDRVCEALNIPLGDLLRWLPSRTARHPFKDYENTP